MPTVSVIVPNYNHARYLPQRLTSILNQTYQDFEVIILDDCSTDNSREIIEQYRSNPKVSKIVYNEINGGTSYKQWYKGIQYAKGDLIWIAESDDWCHVTFLETLVSQFKIGITISFCRTKYFYNNEEEFPCPLEDKEIIVHNGIEFISNFLLKRNYIMNGSMAVFRRLDYLSLKDHSWSEMKFTGDWMLWTLLSGKGNVVEVADELNYCRKHAENATNRFRKKGYDFIEGVKVLNVGKSLCNNNFNRRQVYVSLIKYYKLIKEEYTLCVTLKVWLCFAKYEPFMCYYYMYLFLKENYKKCFR